MDALDLFFIIVAMPFVLILLIWAARYDEDRQTMEAIE